jgi:hypothetical protein
MSPNRFAVSLPNLPQELMDNITSLLQRPADVSSLSMTCKSVRAATVQCLFQDITMVWYADSTVERVGGEPKRNGTPRIDCLLRTLLENPESANYVFTLDFQIAGYRASRYHKSPHKPQLPTMAASKLYTLLVDNALRRVGPHWTAIHETIRHGVLNNEFDAVVALVLLLCPRLASLNLGIDILLYNKFLATILGHALPGQTSAFQQLKTPRLGTNTLAAEHTSRFRVEYPRKWPEATLDLPAYLPLFYLPALQDVEMSLPWSRYGVSFKWPQLPSPNLKSLRTLHLPECSMEPRDLHKILLSTPNLVALKYNCWLFYTKRLDASVLSAALEPVKNTLKHLEVKLNFWSSETVAPGEDDEDERYVDGACSLKNMIALETLSISACVLAGWWNATARAFADVLPPNVTSLQLVGDCYWFENFDWQQSQLLAALRTFVEQEQWKQSTPRLQEIRVAYTEWEEDEELSHLCEQNGLDWYNEVEKAIKRGWDG